MAIYVYEYANFSLAHLFHSAKVFDDIRPFTLKLILQAEINEIICDNDEKICIV